MKKKLSILSSAKPFYIYHVIIIIVAAVLLLSSPRRVSTNFLDIIPNNGVKESMVKADKVFTSSQNSSVNVFVSSKSFEQAKDVAENLFEDLQNSGLYEKISLSSSTIDVDSLRNFVNANVYLLLDEETCRKINEDPYGFQDDSLSSIFSAFTISSMNVLGEDPFLLSENIWMRLLQQVTDATSISPKEGVLAAELDGIWYILINGTLKQETMNIAKTKGGVGDIFTLGDSYINDEVQIYYSGVPFHSFESASNSQKEITWITAVSVVAILVLFLVVCRNFHILKLFAVSLVLAITSAFSVLIIFFKDFHIMTLIFGTTLIGTCIDYSIHFFVRYVRKNPEQNGHDIQRTIFKSLTIGFVSTELCYLLLLISPYAILKQISLFSAGGLPSSYLTALFLYPKIISEKMINEKALILRKETGKPGKPYLIIIAVAATVLFVCQIPEMRIHNNISDLYTPSERLLKGETVFSKVMGYTETTYAIIEADTEEEAMETEVAFTSQLNGLDGYVAVSSYLPSISQQKRSIEASEKLMELLDDQAAILGLSDKEVSHIRETVKNLKPCLSASSLEDSIGALLSSISLGKIGEKYYQVVLIRNASDPDAISKLAGEFENVVYFQTSKDISRQLDELTRIIFILFAAAIAVIFIALIVIFGVKQGFLMGLAPYSVIVSTIAFATLANMPLDFFFVVALVLILGLGLDYIVFALERKQSSPFVAVTLSFITTELSFGSLLFSSFKPVHTFGITVFFGILIAYICALTSGRENNEK